VNQPKPLSGKRIVVTRARSQAEEFMQKIEELGGVAISCPVIKTVPPANQAALDNALARLPAFDWIFFTSVNGVAFFFKRLNELAIDVKTIRAHIAAVGNKTAAALKAKGIAVEHIPGKFTAEDLLETMRGKLLPGQEVLLPRASIAREVLPRELAGMGLQVTDVPVYDTVIVDENVAYVKQLLKEKAIDMITFTSPSTVRNLLHALTLDEREWLQLDVEIAVIGPVTAAAVAEEGLHVKLMAEEYTIDGLLKAMANQAG
jgi:uroporphyrinogen-III synthase